MSDQEMEDELEMYEYTTLAGEKEPKYLIFSEIVPNAPLTIEIIFKGGFDLTVPDQIAKFEEDYEKAKDIDLHMRVYSLSGLLDEDNTGKVIRLIDHPDYISNNIPVDLEREENEYERITITSIGIN